MTKYAINITHNDRAGDKLDVAYVESQTPEQALAQYGAAGVKTEIVDGTTCVIGHDPDNPATSYEIVLTPNGESVVWG